MVDSLSHQSRNDDIFPMAEASSAYIPYVEYVALLALNQRDGGEGIHGHSQGISGGSR